MSGLTKPKAALAGTAVDPGGSGGGLVDPVDLKGKKLLPHWKLRMELARSRLAGKVEISLVLWTARKNTV